LANIVDDVDSLHVEIDNLNDLLIGFCFIRSIDMLMDDQTKELHSAPIDSKVMVNSLSKLFKKETFSINN
jgi:hypothetical protein